MVRLILFLLFNICITFNLFKLAKSGPINVTILHTNDVHARFASFDPRMKPCVVQAVGANSNGECWGGAARRLTAIKKIRNEHKNVLLLDGGDQFQGTLWYTVLKWKPIAEIVNVMGYDAMSFGNHEFDDGLSKPDNKLGEIGLAPYLKKVNSVFVSSNLESKGSEIEDLYKKYHIVEIGKEKIGIVGYITPETVQISHPGNRLKFLYEIDSLKSAVKDVQTKGVDKIIAIGHSGFDMDKKICEQVDGIDVVVGGHTNTFLYTGREPTKQKSEGGYPTVIKQGKSGHQCLVVQDYAFGKYLGFLQVEFDKKGNVKSWNGNPILIDGRFPEDPTIKGILRPYESIINEFQKSIIGSTAVTIDGHRMRCRLKECNFGNLVADAMIYTYLRKKWDQVDLSKGWAISAIAFVNSASFRDFEAEPMANITMADLYNTIPYANTVELIRLKGSHIIEALEHSVRDIEKTYDDPHGKFLQVAGIRVDYDLSRENGHRVQKVQVKCAGCSIPVFEDIMPEKAYNVVTISFLKKGGDGYNMIADNLLYADGLETLDIDVISDYITTHSPITLGLEGRIRFLTENDTLCLTASAGYDRPHSLSWYYAIFSMFYLPIIFRLAFY